MGLIAIYIMNLRAHLYKFQFSHFEEQNGSATAMLHRMSSGATYKQLYMKFAWQLCLFLLTLNVAASLYQAIEGHHVVPRDRGELAAARERILRNFSSTYKVSFDALDQLVSNVQNANEVGTKRSINYLEAFILALSAFFTIGWGHIIPMTDGGKIFCCVSSIIGIPLTIMVIKTGAKLTIRHMQDLIRVTQTNYTKKKNKYGDTKINTRTRSLLLPSLLVLLLLYWLLTSAAIMKIEKFSYIDALYFSFCTFSTIGFGDYYKKSMLVESDDWKVFGYTLFSFVWIFCGVILLAANIVTFYLYQKKPMRLGKKQKKTAKISEQLNPSLLESAA